MSVAQEAVNLLVWRYMKESGFEHSAFLFESESQIDTTSVDVQQIPSVALVTYLQKALRYMDNEKMTNHALSHPESKDMRRSSHSSLHFPASAPADEEALQSGPSKMGQILPAVVSVLAYSCRFAPTGTVLATAREGGTVVLLVMPEGVVSGHAVLGEATVPCLQPGTRSRKRASCRTLK